VLLGKRATKGEGGDRTPSPPPPTEWCGTGGGLAAGWPEVIGEGADGADGAAGGGAPLQRQAAGAGWPSRPIGSVAKCGGSRRHGECGKRNGGGGTGGQWHVRGGGHRRSVGLSVTLSKWVENDSVLPSRRGEPSQTEQVSSRGKRIAPGIRIDLCGYHPSVPGGSWAGVINQSKPFLLGVGFRLRGRGIASGRWERGAAAPG